ncbi:hypothetical protein [Actinocrispum sp. NPDC049592]|uniref:hypothetical protein n=1 Tax=Actinocrispum sp. NPDC049592 TaxID=3154835 RepID=UPI0034387195
MDATTAQLITATVAVGGTLLGAVITQVVSWRLDAARRKAEDQRRWLNERFRILKEIVSGSVKVERNLYSALAFMPETDSPKDKMRASGTTSLLMAPNDGIEGVVSAEDLEVLRELLRECIEALEELDDKQAELAILAEGGIVEKSEELIGRLWDVIGHLEVYGSASDGFLGYDAAHKTRLELQAMARRMLGSELDVGGSKRKGKRGRKGVVAPVDEDASGQIRPISSYPGPSQRTS